VIKTTAVMKTGVGFELPEGEARVAGLEILTGDTNIVSVAMTLQYVIGNPAAFLFDIEAPAALVGLVAESVLTETVLGMPVDEVLTTRAAHHPGAGQDAGRRRSSIVTTAASSSPPPA